MSLKSLREFLPAAFKKIDRAHTREDDSIKRQLKEILEECTRGAGTIDIGYARGIVTIYSYSQAVKQKIFLQREEIITRSRQKLPHILIRDLMFKGPK